MKAWTISDHGETLAVGRENGGIEIWNLKTGQLHRSFPHVGISISHLAFSRSAISLAAASERPSKGAADLATLRIWETASGVIAGTFTNAFGPLAFSSDRQRLVSTRLDGSVVVWDLGSGRSVAEIAENFTWIGALALSPDDRLLVTGSEAPVVNISELASGKRIDSLKGTRICIDGVGFSPDARTLATRTVDGAMKFWGGSFISNPFGRILCPTCRDPTGRDGRPPSSMSTPDSQSWERCGTATRASCPSSKADAALSTA